MVEFMVALKTTFPQSGNDSEGYVYSCGSNRQIKEAKCSSD